MPSLVLCAYNVENLFVFMEDYRGENLATMEEKKWQSLTYGLTPNKELKKLHALALTMEHINADIFLLSEVGGAQSLINFNRYFLQERFEVFHQEGNSPRGIDLAFLVKKGLPYHFKLSGHRERQIALKEKKTKFSRDLLELSLNHKKNKKRALTLLLLHLKSKISNPHDYEGTDQRSAEVGALISHYQKLQKKMKGKALVVVGGDMNAIAARAEVGPEFRRLYEETDLVDLHDLKKSTTADRCTYVHFMGARRALNQIDYLFLSQSLHSRVDLEHSYTYRYQNEGGEVLELPHNRRERNLLPSDHYPLVLTLNLPS